MCIFFSLFISIMRDARTLAHEESDKETERRKRERMAAGDERANIRTAHKQSS